MYVWIKKFNDIWTLNSKKYHEEPYALSLDWLSFYMTILPDSPLITNPHFEEFSHSNVVLHPVPNTDRTHSNRYRAWIIGAACMKYMSIITTSVY